MGLSLHLFLHGFTMRLLRLCVSLNAPMQIKHTSSSSSSGVRVSAVGVWIGTAHSGALLGLVRTEAYAIAAAEGAAVGLFPPDV